MSDTITFEQPLNERMRTFMRVEELYARCVYYIDQDHPWDTHIAVSTLIELWSRRPLRPFGEESGEVMVGPVACPLPWLNKSCGILRVTGRKNPFNSITSSMRVSCGQVQRCRVPLSERGGAPRRVASSTKHRLVSIWVPLRTSFSTPLAAAAASHHRTFASHAHRT